MRQRLPLSPNKYFRRYISTSLRLVQKERRLVLRLPQTRAKRCSEGLWAVFRGVEIGIVGHPGFAPLIKCDCINVVLSSMPKAAFYAVAAGRVPGIYTTWSECESQVKGYTSAKFKKFSSESEAKQYIESNSSRSNPSSRPNTSIKASVPATTSDPRSGSPPAHAILKDLPPDLAKLARQGWRFSKRIPHALVVYTDGSGLGNGKVGAKAGLGVWWGNTGNAVRSNLSERVPGELQTNNRGELLSVIRALETCPFPDLPLEIRTDSQYTIMCMTTYLPGWIKNGFMTVSRSTEHQKDSAGGGGSKKVKVKNTDMIKHLLVLLRRRKPRAGVRFKYVPGHAGVEGNEGADLLARQGAVQPALPDRNEWLDPDQDEVGAINEPDAEPSQVDVEFDESWLMTPEELNDFEKDFEEIDGDDAS